jgi:maleamate amidohydrolase
MTSIAIDPFEDHCWKDLLTPEIQKIFSYYRRELRVGRKPALLMIDLYNLAYLGGSRPVHEIVDEHSSSSGVHAWASIEPTQRVLRYFREEKLPVIHVTYDDRPETDHQAMNPSFRKKLAYDPWLYQTKDELAPVAGEQFIFKKRASSFFGTPLLTSLVQQGCDSVVCVGQSTSGCVRATVVDAFSNGFKVAVAEECVYDRSELSHKVNLFDMHHKYADVFKTEDLLAALKTRPR